MISESFVHTLSTLFKMYLYFEHCKLFFTKLHFFVITLSAFSFFIIIIGRERSQNDLIIIYALVNFARKNTKHLTMIRHDDDRRENWKGARCFFFWFFCLKKWRIIRRISLRKIICHLDNLLFIHQTL